MDVRSSLLFYAGGLYCPVSLVWFHFNGATFFVFLLAFVIFLGRAVVSIFLEAFFLKTLGSELATKGSESSVASNVLLRSQDSFLCAWFGV